MRRLAMVLLLLGACKDDPEKSYDTYQNCFDDLVEKEMKPVVDAIVECCADHPIAGAKPSCGADEPACANFLANELREIDAGQPERMDACAIYVAGLPAGG